MRISASASSSTPLHPVASIFRACAGGNVNASRAFELPPFAYEGWMFMHYGFVGRWARLPGVEALIPDALTRPRHMHDFFPAAGPRLGSEARLIFTMREKLNATSMGGGGGGVAHSNLGRLKPGIQTLVCRNANNATGEGEGGVSALAFGVWSLYSTRRLSIPIFVQVRS